jgi:hypothetical protein
LPDRLDPAAQDLDRQDQAMAQLEVGLDRSELALDGRRIERGLERRADQAAIAICAVVTAVPWARISGSAAAMMLARRASGGSGAARRAVDIAPG